MKVVFPKVWILLTLFLLYLHFATAREKYTLRTFTTKDGLPHNQVLSIAQDSTGFLWIATWDGLSRFDGYEFKNYYHNPLDTTTLPYFSLNDLAISNSNELFVTSVNYPPVIFNKPDERFLKTIPLNIFINHSISATTKGNVYFFYPGEGLMRWDKLKVKPVPVSIFLPTGKKDFSSVQYIEIRFDNLDNLWFFQYEPKDIEASIVKMNGDSGYIKQNFRFRNPYLDFQVRGNTPKNWFTPFIIPAKDTLMVTLTGLNRISAKLPGKLIPVSELDFRKNNTTCTFLIWPDGRHHLYYLAPGKNIADTIRLQEYPFLAATIRDKKGSFWASALSSDMQGKELVQAVPIKPFFRHYLGNENPPGNTNGFFAVHKDRFGYVWAATKLLNYIYKISSGGKKSRVNLLDSATINLAFHPRSFLEDSAGIWIGYYNNLLMRYDFSSGKFTKVYFQRFPIIEKDNSEGFRDMIPSRDGLVTGLDYSIYLFDTKLGKLIRKNTLPLADNLKYTMNKLTPAPGGGYFAGFNYGLIRRYDNNFQQTGEWQIPNVPFNVEDICPGDENDLWIALLGGGLAHIDLKNSELKSYTTANGLSNNTCYSILKDRKGNLWISTNHGISRFNPNTKQFRTFDASDGLHINEFNSDASYLAPDGEMFFGGMGDIVSFYPDSLEDNISNQPPARLVITNFKVSGITRYFEKAVYDMDAVSLSKGDNNFQVTFACLDFQNPEKIRYRYRLSGENSSWTETDWRHRFVNYANLTPGSYMLDIEATNRNGDWVSKLLLFIKIPPFYYQTLWFRLLILLAIFILAVWLIYSYNSRIRLKAKKEQQQLRLESLRGQMNPHFIFNSLNSINYFISQNDRLSANRYIADFSRLIRSIMGNLSSDYIPFPKELESLHDYLKLEHLRFGDKFDYSVLLPEETDLSETMVFPGIVQPFVENAIWHGVRGLEGRKGQIRINFRRTGTNLTCIVEDDGIGRKLAHERKSDLPGKTSRGIGIVLERLRIINNLKNTNYRIVMEDLYPEKEETGTRVIIDIPVKT